MVEPVHMEKNFHKPFILSRSKFTRLCEVIENKLKKTSTECDFQKKFEVTMKDGKNITIPELDDIFNLDNTRRNYIVDIDITYTMPDKDSIISINFNGDKFKGIYSIVSGPNLTWANETIAEIEEQIERTIPEGIFYKINPMSSMWVTVFLGLIASLVGFFGALNGLEQTRSNLPENMVSQLKYLETKAVTNDAKINYIYNYIKMSVNTSQLKKTQNVASYLTDWRMYCVGVPLIIIVMAIIYQFKYSYPRAVFEWGDMEDVHKKTVERRKLLWNVVIVSILTGILSSLFVFGLSSFIK